MLHQIEGMEAKKVAEEALTHSQGRLGKHFARANSVNFVEHRPCILCMRALLSVSLSHVLQRACMA